MSRISFYSSILFKYHLILVDANARTENETEFAKVPFSSFINNWDEFEDYVSYCIYHLSVLVLLETLLNRLTPYLFYPFISSSLLSQWSLIPSYH